MERDRFARKIGRKVGRFVEERIIDVDISDAFIVATVVGAGILLRDRILDAGISRHVKKSVVEIIQRSKF